MTPNEQNSLDLCRKEESSRRQARRGLGSASEWRLLHRLLLSRAEERERLVRVQEWSSV